MNYRSINDLNDLVSRELCRVPRSVDLIVGIPRSGLLVANLLALKLNLPLTDVSGLCEKRLLQAGMRGRGFRFEAVKHALVVDDSINTGESIRSAKVQIGAANLPLRLDYAAVYASLEAQKYVDFYWEACPMPRVFEWNVMHHSVIEKACVDIDGVLCRDPDEYENDDGEKYLHFLRTAHPLVVPSGSIQTIVTCRLEKYRSVTKQWLASVGIRYGELVMLDLPDGEARRKWRKHGEFKGDIYKKSGARLFIESSQCQALKIANFSAKPVFATDINKMIFPGTVPVIKLACGRLPNFIKIRINYLKNRVLKRMHPKSYGL